MNLELLPSLGLSLAAWLFAGATCARAALWDLIRSRLQASGVHPLAVSSNPGIESNHLRMLFP